MNSPSTPSRPVCLHGAALLGLMLGALLVSGCGLFAKIEEPGCEDLPQTCVCPGGQMGVASCDEQSLAITSCDCSATTSCGEDTRELCRCAAAEPSQAEAAIGMSACDDATACVCQEFAPSSTSSALAIPRFDGTQSLDGSCAEFAGVPVAPHAGFRSDEDFARMSCRLMWQARPDDSRALLGCCLVPDTDVLARADAQDPPSVRGADGSKGDDRIEIALSDASGVLHQLAINTQMPSPVIFASTISGQTTTLTTTQADAHIELSGQPNDASSDDTGYTIEWTWPLPEALSSLDAFSCQLSRYDVDGADVASSTLDQEHTFGPNRTASPLSQTGACTLSTP